MVGSIRGITSGASQAPLAKRVKRGQAAARKAAAKAKAAASASRKRVA